MRKYSRNGAVDSWVFFSHHKLLCSGRSGRMIKESAEVDAQSLRGHVMLWLFSYPIGFCDLNAPPLYFRSTA